MIVTMTCIFYILSLYTDVIYFIIPDMIKILSIFHSRYVVTYQNQVFKPFSSIIYDTCIACFHTSLIL